MPGEGVWATGHDSRAVLARLLLLVVAGLRTLAHSQLNRQPHWLVSAHPSRPSSYPEALLMLSPNLPPCTHMTLPRHTPIPKSTKRVLGEMTARPGPCGWAVDWLWKPQASLAAQGREERCESGVMGQGFYQGWLQGLESGSKVVPRGRGCLPE